MEQKKFITRSRIALIDLSSVLHASKHALGKGKKLSHNEQCTFVIYGFLFRLRSIVMHSKADVLAFAIDSHTSIRKERIYTQYKSNRDDSKKTDDQILLDTLARLQFKIVIEEVIPQLGYKNVFCAEGFEADDVIARVCRSYPDNEIAIITSDKDMYQVLSDTVAILKPKDYKWYTKEMFQRDYGIEPELWKKVKTYGGCTTDGVPGIRIPDSVRRVGEGTALKFVKGELKPTYKAHAAFQAKINKKRIVRNRFLTVLPFIGTPDFTIEPDRELSKEALIDICKKYGFKSILSDSRDFCRILKLK